MGTPVPDVEIEFPPLPEFVGLARHVIAALVRLRDPASAIVEDVKLAVSEACTNAVTVTQRAASPGPVVVRGEMERSTIRLWVLDRGAPGMAGAESRSPADPDSLDFSFGRGLSLPLLEGLVDELEIAPREEGGNEVRMVLSSREGGPG